MVRRSSCSLNRESERVRKVIGARQVFQKLLIYWVYIGPHKEKISSEQHFSGWKCYVDGRSQENGQTASTWQEGNSNSDNHSLHPKYAGKHLEADGQQQKKTTPGVSYEQETVTTIHMNSPALNKRRLQKHCVVWWVSISPMMGSECGVNTKAWTHPVFYQQCNDGGDIFLAHFGTDTTSWALFKCYSLSE